MIGRFPTGEAKGRKQRGGEVREKDNGGFRKNGIAQTQRRQTLTQAFAACAQVVGL